MLPWSIVARTQERLGLKHIIVGDLIQEHQCYEGRDEALDTFILDEDKLLTVLEPLLEGESNDDDLGNDDDSSPGGVVVDFHVCDMFPEHWFDLVLVLRAKTDVLFDRLTARHYSDRKRSENVESEIMQVILEEAREAYSPDIVHEVPSNTLEDMESNIQRVQQWMAQWMVDHGNSPTDKIVALDS